MTIREWLSKLNNEQLAEILEELKSGKYNNSNLDFNFAIRFQKILPCLGEKNCIKEWLEYEVTDLN